eukprot:TRINITY_DN21590_c0_g1_i1.p1 TRINITY_DN21590_c0_g1~~TRINITY_DN21590_c0_g1_i1.p1  ORF type:complete len:247 (-),score=32.18 TRINITY_DN21590_c0_g1_i1:37-777(-)
MNAAGSAATASVTSAAKATLRQQMRRRLKALDDLELTRQSEAVRDRLVGTQLYSTSRNIGIFLSMPSGELRTEPLLQHAFESGKRVFCPRVMGPGLMEMFEVRSAEEARSLPLSKWHIPEPPAETPRRLEPGDLDLLLVPAVALDLARRRCGHGMGFYDRYIARARTACAAERASDVAAGTSCAEAGDLTSCVARCFHAVGIGLSEQHESEVPSEEHDQLLDGVVFPHEEVWSEEISSLKTDSSSP